MSEAASVVFALLTLAAVAFQLALAAGAPWGKLAMGGRFPGKLPTAMRVAAVVQALVLLFLATIVMVRAGWSLPGLLVLSRKAIWIVVLFSLLSVIMNLMTPSRSERALWAPVALLMAVCSLVVALE